MGYEFDTLTQMTVSCVQVFCESRIMRDNIYEPSTGRTVYNVSLVLDNNIVHCNLIDIPTVRYIPKVFNIFSELYKTKYVVSKVDGNNQ